jgi:hypothetical protein
MKTSNRTPKTREQLAYYYAVILPTAHRQLVADGHETMGVPISKDMADMILKHYSAPKRDGKPINKAAMTKMEAVEFIDNCIRWCAATLHCVIPEPEAI